MLGFLGRFEAMVRFEQKRNVENGDSGSSKRRKEERTDVPRWRPFVSIIRALSKRSMNYKQINGTHLKAAFAYVEKWFSHCSACHRRRTEETPVIVIMRNNCWNFVLCRNRTNLLCRLIEVIRTAVKASMVVSTRAIWWQLVGGSRIINS